MLFSLLKLLGRAFMGQEWHRGVRPLPWLGCTMPGSTERGSQRHHPEFQLPAGPGCCSIRWVGCHPPSFSPKSITLSSQSHLSKIRGRDHPPRSRHRHTSPTTPPAFPGMCPGSLFCADPTAPKRLFNFIFNFTASP